MKKSILTLALSTILLMIFNTSCTKNPAIETIPSSSTENAKVTKKLMNVLMYTREAYLDHDAHDYAEGHILEFSTNWKSLKSVNGPKIQNALEFMKQAVLTGDTTGQYMNLFTYVLPNSVFMDVYPDSALIFGSPASYTAFKTWFESTCLTWMTLHQCSNIVENTNTPKYIMKIHCQVN